MPIITALFTVARWAGLWAKIKDGASWIVARRDRALAAIALLLGLTAWWQHHEAREWATQARHTKAAWDAARRDAEAAKAKAEKRYKELASHADQTHAADVAQGDARLAAFITSHRLRMPQADPARAAQDRSPALPANPATQTIVAVSEADLRTCEADYAYAKAAHDWAMSLLAQP